MNGVDGNKLLSCVLLLLVLGAAAVPAAVTATQHSARGAGWAHQDGLTYAFRFRAEGAPNAATGQIALNSKADGALEGTVDCLFVDGRRAVLTGVVDSPLTLLPYFAIAVKDIGKDTDRPRDRILLQFDTQPIPCENASFLTNDTRITRGDIVVH